MTDTYVCGFCKFRRPTMLKLTYGVEVRYACKSHLLLMVIRMLDEHTGENGPDAIVQVSRFAQELRDILTASYSQTLPDLVEQL